MYRRLRKYTVPYAQLKLIWCLHSAQRLKFTGTQAITIESKQSLLPTHCKKKLNDKLKRLYLCMALVKKINVLVAK